MNTILIEEEEKEEIILAMMNVIAGKIPDEEAKRAGLVDCHAYALLDLRKLDVSFYITYFLINNWGRYDNANVEY